MFYLSIAGGVIKGLVRFILGTIISTFTFNIITEPCLPYWVTKFKIFDKISGSYYAMIFMYHTYNHPIFVTAANIFIESLSLLKKF